MNNKNFNVDYFSYQGEIDRKNYAINMAILIAIFVGLSFLNIDAFMAYTKLKFLSLIIQFAIGLVKFLIGFSIISLIYRRINDITYNKSAKVKDIMRKIYIAIYIIPIFYYICGDFIFGIMPPIKYFLDLTLIILFIPIMTVFAFVISFIKGR